MKKYKTQIWLIFIALSLTLILTYINITSEYPDGIGMDRIPFDYAWFNIYVYTSSMYLILATLVLIFTCKNIHSIYHSGAIKNMIQRESFGKIKKNYLFKAWKNSLFLYPFFLGFTYIIFRFLFPTAGVGINLYQGGPMIDSLFILFRGCIITILYSIVVINVTLIISKKSRRFAITTILSFLIIIIYAVISQLIYPIFLRPFFSTEFIKGFDLINGMLFGFGDSISILIHGIILIIISTIILYRIYGDVNEVVLHYENEN